MELQGNFTQEEWDTLNVFQLTTLHIMRSLLALYCPDLTEWILGTRN